MKDYLIGFDIGGTKCAVILGRYAGDGVQILDRIAFATESSRGPGYALGKLEKAASDIVERSKITFDAVEAIGISCGGPLDSRKGLILGPPNLPGWDNIAIVERYEARLGVRTKLQNDANACALAEWQWGAGRGCNSIIFLTFGTGLGAGLVLDGRLYVGANDLAGEVGHIRLADDGPVGYGKPGSFEGFCSGGGIEQLAKLIIQRKWVSGETVDFCADESCLDNINARNVGDAARAGDITALEIYKTVGERLGQGLSILIDTLNPERIIIGSVFARQQELIWPAAEQVINKEALTLAAGICKVVPAALGEAIGDYASLSVAAS